MRCDRAHMSITEDRLLGGRVAFAQPADGYRAAIDPVLLAAAIPARDGDAVLELGSGAGAAALCLAARVPGCSVTGIERDPTLVDIANSNAAINGMADRVRFIVGDVASPPDDLGVSYDHAIANPPFLESDRADRRGDSNPLRDAAMIESEPALEAVLDLMCRSVRAKGRVTLVHRADRLADILSILHPLAGDITVLPLWPKVGQVARRTIVSARPGTAAPLRLLSGIALHEGDGRYTAAVQAILNEAAPLSL